VAGGALTEILIALEPSRNGIEVPLIIVGNPPALLAMYVLASSCQPAIYCGSAVRCYNILISGARPAWTGHTSMRMGKKKLKHVNRRLTDKERARHARIRDGAMKGISPKRGASREQCPAEN